MADVNWREAGFLAQTTGNYPDASDVADKDNIFLTDQGWVYRHFKNPAKTKFWDEIIWAGYVDADVPENDPVDYLPDEPTADVTFLVGDGYQFVEGPYPTSVTPPAAPTIGSVGVAGPGTAVDGETKSYSVNVNGGTATGFTYTWSVTGGTVASGAGTDSVTVTFNAVGNATVSCSVASAGASNTPQSDDTVVAVSAPAPTTGPVTGVTMTGTTSSQTDGSYTGQNTVSDNGSGLTVDYDVNSYVVSNVSVNDGGSGYEDGDEFTIVGTGGTAKGTVSI